MLRQMTNGAISIWIDTECGTVNALYFEHDANSMNWLISSETLCRYGYQDESQKQLGKSSISFSGKSFNTENILPTVQITDTEARFSYDCEGVRLTHAFLLCADRLQWHIELENTTKEQVTIDTLYHWMPVNYVMHQTRQENLTQSTSFVPSISGDKSYVFCKKRSGTGPNLLVLNTGHAMRSTGSLCKYENLFFEKSAPSLSGLVLFNAVTAYPPPQQPTVDWQYRTMYMPITLAPNKKFSDMYDFVCIDSGKEREVLYRENFPVFDFPPVTFCGKESEVKLHSKTPPVRFKIETATQQTVEILYEGEKIFNEDTTYWRLVPPPSTKAGERRLTVYFADGTSAFIVFAMYASMREMILAFCGGIYKNRFIDNPSDPNYCGYRSVSRQGESCAKGSLLLLKNLLDFPCEDEIMQVERNAVYYLRPRWLNEDFTAVKQYPGGFARIIDLDYLILEFYLLSKFSKSQLALHNPDTYLMWTYHTAIYRFTVTPDKLPRESVEVELASMISWLQLEMLDELPVRGHAEEAAVLKKAWDAHIRIQLAKTKDKSYVETEHYFDNAGISVYAETLFNNGNIEAAIPAADLLLANVADSTDYRNYAPDRWWEAFAPMYHNLWAVFSAKALLSAYEKTKQTKYLFPAYRAMMPMFYNYDWTAVSALNRFEKGNGVSAYCLTSPNLNTPVASRNRFGQSIFKDEFFSQMDVSGDDWDLGADMVVYMYTFGQNAYVVQKGSEWAAINADIEHKDGCTVITSHAAYPTCYEIAPLGLTVKRKDSGIRIISVTLQNNVCTEVILEGSSISAEQIEVVQNNKKVPTPEIKYLK